MSEDFKAGFLKTLWILKSYLPEIVVGGGWVPLVYYHYLLADKSKDPIHTRDIDILVDEKLPVIGSKTIDQLLSEAGFEAKFKTLEKQPAMSYEGNVDGHEVEIEFLTHQKGAKEATAVEVQKGLKAQPLRFTTISINNTIEVEIDDFPGGGKTSLKVRVPSPGAYLFHKGLVFPRRQMRQKKAKDLYYIFDILANCPELREQIVVELDELKKAYPANWFKNFRKNLKTYFSTIVSEGVILVAEQRPKSAFPELNGEQFKQYVLSIFEEFVRQLRN